MTTHTHKASAAATGQPSVMARWTFVGTFSDDWPSELRDLVGRVVIAFGQLERVLYLTPKRIRGEELLVYADWPDGFRNAERCNQIEEEAGLILVGERLEILKQIISETGLREQASRRTDFVSAMLAMVSSLEGLAKGCGEYPGWHCNEANSC